MHAWRWHGSPCVDACRMDGVKAEYCTPEVFKPENLGVFQRSLMFFLRLAYPTTQAEKMHLFWGHEWSKHGSCSGNDQLTYFMSVFQASMQNPLTTTLAQAAISPSNARTYSMAQLRRAIVSKYGAAVHPTRSLLCVPDDVPGQWELAEVRLCLSKLLKPVDCSALKAEGLELPLTEAQRSGEDPFFRAFFAINGTPASADPVPCPVDPNAAVYFRDFQDSEGSVGGRENGYRIFGCRQMLRTERLNLTGTLPSCC